MPYESGIFRKGAGLHFPCWSVEYYETCDVSNGIGELVDFREGVLRSVKKCNICSFTKWKRNSPIQGQPPNSLEQWKWSQTQPHLFTISYYPAYFIIKYYLWSTFPWLILNPLFSRPASSLVSPLASFSVEFTFCKIKLNYFPERPRTHRCPLGRLRYQSLPGRTLWDIVRDIMPAVPDAAETMAMYKNKKQQQKKRDFFSENSWDLPGVGTARDGVPHSASLLWCC